ncbi:sigma-70 family RNA polymerase sigma factor [Tepidibacillus decaturensis]|uniref:RNA polymerase sigma-70 domain-containing protein n=1 Tax=Tepidibacillus decaturensis TaxID=1413211 RepID=A0A135L0Y9_9BACI|nr:sigma-70 family RNA polymerase sigma factor [Tepidibacillus decaturensis]KXG42660.1 hypothetical protein U473_00310 [Tepidibacillus decaturensis]
MTNEELVELIQSGVNVTENLGILYQQNQGILMKWAYPYSKQVDIEDLMQEAYFGLKEAAENHNAALNFKFLTYAHWRVLQKIVRYVHSNQHSKRIPEYLLQRISNYHKLKKAFLEDYGREPTKDEYMEHLQISKKVFRELERYISEIDYINLDAPILEGKTLSEVVSDNYDLEKDVTERLTQNQLSSDVWKAVDELDELKRDIIIQKYKNNCTLTEIALNKQISATRVEQIEKKALHLLSKKQWLQYLAIERFGYDSRISYKYGVQKFKDRRTSSTEFIAMKNIQIQEEISKVDNLLNNIANL